MVRTLLIAVLCVLFAACNNENKSADSRIVYVSITPLKSIVEEVTCGDFDVHVLVPQGASPETFEPTAKQIADLNESRFLFQTGLIDFEQSIVGRVGDGVNVVDLSEGVALLSGSCSHHHHNHAHGIDPHIWTSPQALMLMVENVRTALVREFPDSTKYSDAAERVQQRIEQLDGYCKQRINDAGVELMMIYHPAYTYFARDYGVEQMAIEHDGKEPSPRQLTSLIETAKANDVKTIFIQPQYSEDKVRSIADECGAEIVVTDPLCDDILAEIRRVTDLICRTNE